MSSSEDETAEALARLVQACQDSVSGLTIAAFAAAAWATYLAASASLGRILRARCTPISGLRSLLSSAESSGDCPPLIVVRGRVKPGYALKALARRAASNKRATPFLKNPVVPVLLVEGSKWGSSDFVHINLDGSDHPLHLTKDCHGLHPVPATSYGFSRASFGNGYPVASLDGEQVLSAAREITAIGFCRQRNGYIEINSCKEFPYFLSDMTKDEIVAELDSKTRLLFWSGIFLGTISIGLIGYAFISNWWKWKEWKMTRRRQNELRNLDMTESSTEEEDVQDGELCVICLSTRRRSAFIPCGHFVCCHRCARHVELGSSPTCPVCRKNIRSSIRIFGF